MLLNPLDSIEKLKEIYKNCLDEDEAFDESEFNYWCDNHFSCFDEDNIREWYVHESDGKIEFSCGMDNFQYREYAEVIGVPKRAFK